MSIHLSPVTSAIASQGASATVDTRHAFYDEDDGIPCSLLEAIFGLPPEATQDRPASKGRSYHRFGAMPWLVGVALVATALWVGA